MRTLGVIPARYGSTRFPGKPLALIAGKPLIQHVYERAIKSSSLDELIVATDDQRIIHTVQQFGGKAALTDKHPTGTDRVAEVSFYNPGFDTVVNIQGDEPLLDPSLITMCVKTFNASHKVAPLTPVTQISDEERLAKTVVKAVVSRHQRACFFTRHPVATEWKHIGLYVYSSKHLDVLRAVGVSSLETRELLEQMRFIDEYGFVSVIPYNGTATQAVDVPSDVELVERLLNLC